MKQQLYNLIKGHKVASYGAIWGAFDSTDTSESVIPDSGGCTQPGADGDHDIPDIYSNKCWEEFSEQCGQYSHEGDCYNREHSWPKSWWGGDKIPAYTDLHHLYPTDGKVNSKRSNYPFCKVAAASYHYEGSKLGSCDAVASYGFSGTGFELKDEWKGNIARSYFYMATRYGGDGYTCCDKEAVSGFDIKPWQVSLLLDWHAADPVSGWERERNSDICAQQLNRNPYIDHPEWVAKIFKTAEGAPKTPVFR